MKMEQTPAGYFQSEDRRNFDLELVYQHLADCRISDDDADDADDVDLRGYLSAYTELCRFFKLTGQLFSFVAKDLEYKISLIQQKQTKETENCYKTVKSMIQYEVDNDIALSNDHTSSGSRTLLRLHWALEFILEFMSRISLGTDDDKTSVIASDVYTQTLSNHHPWITRKLAYFAVFFLPSRKNLIEVMCKQDYTTVLQILGKVVHAGRSVYNICDDVLKENNLLNIP